MKLPIALLLILAGPAVGGERVPYFFTACEKAELRQIQSLTRLDTCQLAGVVEQQRASYNESVLMRYRTPDTAYYSPPTQPTSVTSRGRGPIR